MTGLVDVDGVLFDQLDSLLEFASERSGIRLRAEDVTDYRLHLFLGIPEADFKALVAEWYKSPQFRQAKKADPYAHEALERIARKHTLYVATSRPESTRQLTEEAITKHYPGVFRESHFTDSFLNESGRATTKPEIAQKLGAEFLIDDDPMLAGKMNNCMLYLFDRRYNRQVADSRHVKRVSSIYGVARALGLAE